MLNGHTQLSAKWNMLHELLTKENKENNCLPYDHARVKLDKSTDNYINAAFHKESWSWLPKFHHRADTAAKYAKYHQRFLVHAVVPKSGIMTSYQMKIAPKVASKEKEEFKDPLNELDPLWKLK